MGGKRAMSKTLDKVDYKIIAILREDATKTNVQLAEEIGVSEGTIRNRLRCLINEEIIRVVATPVDPKKLGFYVDVYMDIDVEITKITEVARQLAELPQLTYVGIVAGRHDILAHGLFHSTDELLEFITNKIAPIPGINKTETSHVLKIVKRAYLWVSSEELEAE